MYRHRALALNEDGDERKEIGTDDILSHSLQEAISQLIETGSETTRLKPERASAHE